MSSLSAWKEIVDIGYMAKQMQCYSCNEYLRLLDIEKDMRQGVASIFHIGCHYCLLVNVVKSGEEYKNPTSGNPVFSVNTKIALGKYMCLFIK